MAVTFRGCATGLAVLGNGLTTQNLLLIENRQGSRVNVNLRRLAVHLDAVAALSAVMPIVRTSRASSVSAGAILPKAAFNTTQTSNPYVVISAPAVDLFPVTATANTTVWQQYPMRLADATGQVLDADENVMPLLIDQTGKEFVIRPGESVVVQVVAAAGTSNAATTNNWFVNCSWEEDDIGTFTIAGQVTLSAVPVSGAKIVVVEADDVWMPTPVFVGVSTSDGSGNWSASITSGRVGAAFVQYQTGGTYYTAPGSPFLEP